MFPFQSIFRNDTLPAYIHDIHICLDLESECLYTPQQNKDINRPILSFVATVQFFFRYTYQRYILVVVGTPPAGPCVVHLRGHVFISVIVISFECFPASVDHCPVSTGASGCMLLLMLLIKRERVVAVISKLLFGF